MNNISLNFSLIILSLPLSFTHTYTRISLSPSLFLSFSCLFSFLYFSLSSVLAFPILHPLLSLLALPPLFGIFNNLFSSIFRIFSFFSIYSLPLPIFLEGSSRFLPYCSQFYSSLPIIFLLIIPLGNVLLSPSILSSIAFLLFLSCIVFLFLVFS